jgi:RNA polymerase sigma-70 factor (sigma-E family)
MNRSRRPSAASTPVEAAGPDADLPVPPSTTSPAPGTWLAMRDLEREAAVSALFDRHYDQLVRLAFLLGGQHEAEDIAAEAFCELYRRWTRLRDVQAAPAYLRSAVCNLVRMRIRHLQVVRRHHEPLPLPPGSPEHEALIREDQREVVEALGTLSHRQRQALVLRYWLDLPEAEVAAAMGISCGSVKSHTARGMTTLTRLLEERR